MSDRHADQLSAKKAKLKLGLVPADLIVCVAEVMQAGLGKEGRQPHDWQHIEPKLFADAYLRHTLAWWRGEAIDPETGRHHIDLALTNLGILIWFREHGYDIEGWQA